MSTQNRFRLLATRLREISDLDEGRRDLSGILSRAAACAGEILDLPLVYGAAAVDGSSLVAVAEKDALIVRTEPWEGPGDLGQAVLDEQEARTWVEGEAGGPTANDVMDYGGAGAWV